MQTKNIFVIVLFYFTFLSCFSQEELGSISVNLNLRDKSSLKERLNLEKSLENSFDSTIIYRMDTLSLPFFDDFTTNKYQVQNASISDIDIISDKKYRLLDFVTKLPLGANANFSSFETYKRTYTSDTTFTDEAFVSDLITIGDLSVYPVVYNDVDAYPPYYIYDSLHVIGDVSDTIWIVTPDLVQDSATQFVKNTNDSTLLWVDKHAYHNYDFAISPWSLGVMTLDGLDEFGVPYSENSNESGVADYLTSKPIDLTPYTAADSLYFSFLYQSGGFGEVPDEMDSLIVEFYDLENDKWNNVWSTNGVNDTIFRYTHLPVKNASYFTEAFQFRFKNYGHLSGSFDQFHIDYVSLKDSSQFQDTLLIDFAWVYPIKTILKDYTSVPWDHYKNNSNGKIGDKVNFNVRNGSNIQENNQLPSTVSVFYNDILESSSSVTGFSICNSCQNYAPRTVYSSYHDFSNSLSIDNSKTGIKQTFDVVGTIDVQFSKNNRINDTTKFSQVFENYYSYDDGTAEAAYGTTGNQSSLAVRFEAYEKDSLLGIMTSFVKSAVDVSNNLFLLTVWSDNNGIPGSIIYQDDIFFPRTPQYVDSNNGFYTYFFKDDIKLPVDEVFYIGWKQFGSERLNIGFDRNIVKNENTFYSLNEGNTWIQSSIEGIPLMRPVFSTGMNAELGIEEVQLGIENIYLAPNPSNDGIFNLKGDVFNIEKIEVYNLQGKRIHISRENKLDLSFFESGVYIFKIQTDKNVLTIKGIKK